MFISRIIILTPFLFLLPMNLLKNYVNFSQINAQTHSILPVICRIHVFRDAIQG